MTTLDDVIGKSQHRSWVSRAVGLQVFWVFLAAVLACIALGLLTDAFLTQRNLFNVARNFAFEREVQSVVVVEAALAGRQSPDEGEQRQIGCDLHATV